MTHLMRNLDQLNADIEEALSGSSSPADMPSVTRKWPSATFLGTTAYQASSDHSKSCSVDDTGCQNPDSLSALHQSAVQTKPHPSRQEAAVKMSPEEAGAPASVNPMGQNNTILKSKLGTCVEGRGEGKGLD